MNRTEKQLLKRTAQFGLLMTALVIAADLLGALEPLERYLYDIRAQHFQYFTPAPTDRIVHLDIDDDSLNEIGSFPFPRTYMAEMIDEVRLAGAKVIGLDVIFPDRAPERAEKLSDGAVRSIDDDGNFADAIERAGNVLVPVPLDLQERGARPPVVQAVVNTLAADLELDQAQIIAKLRGTKFDSQDLPVQVRRCFLEARQEAMMQRAWTAIEAANQTPTTTSAEPQEQQLLRALLPRAYAAGESTDAVHLLEKVLPRAESIKRLMTFTVPIPPGAPPTLRSQTTQITIPPLLNAARYSGVVQVANDADGLVRSIPLFIEYRGRLIAHMSFAAPCAMLGVPLSEVKIAADSVTVPVPGGPPIVIPVRTVHSKKFGTVGLLMQVPWFGGSDWKTMYDRPAYIDSRQHLPLVTVWAACQYQHQIASHQAQTDEMLFAINDAYKGTFDKCAAFIATPQDKRTDAARADAVEDTLKQMASLMDLPALQKAKPQELNEDDRRFLASYLALQQMKQTNLRLASNLQAKRQWLRSQLEDRYALVCWTAVGAMDNYPTSMHSSCPGGVIQGVVFNAIMTRELWKPVGWWVAPLLTLLMGGVTTAAVTFLSTWRALFSTAALILGCGAIDGLLVFDYGNWLIPAAGPVAAAVLIWFAVTVARYIYEQRERSRITQRFSNYVDPLLVNFVVENPELAGFDGQEKEMSVVFTDLAGFTSVSEKLRERTVPLLNEYMSLMLPIIRQNNGYWNKFLGDGIMFFYNAPAVNATHARDAIYTVLEMQKAMAPFNQRLLERGLPQVAMRAGISTGMMVVGDAGSTDPKHKASDYTVLGDDVNLGARLESANKALGSRVLMNGRTAELITGSSGNGEFLLRPMGCLQVVGKTQGVDTFEAMCLRSEASEKQLKIAETSTHIVTSFKAAKFDECIRAAKEMEDTYGSTKFTQLYLRLSREYQGEPPDDFNGEIVLSEK